MCSSDIFLALIAVIFAPLPVWIKRGLCSADSLINIALCCLGVFPGIFHAWYIIYSTPDYYEYEQVLDVESGRQTRPFVSGGVSYYYVEAPAQQSQGYGSIGSSQVQTLPEAGKSNEIPPPYTEAIKGDNKVQRT